MSLATAFPQSAAQTAPAENRSRALRAVPAAPEPRGFALYVGLDEDAARAAGTSLGAIVEAVKKTIDELAPAAQSYAAVALAPAGVGGRDVDVVRLALQEPTAVARNSAGDIEEDEELDRAHAGVVIDISRKRVVLDNATATLTYKEFELLQYLVLREGRTIERIELINALWSEHEGDIPNERTIDVHVRRLRSKLGRYEDIVRTVRGAGYRFDRHADVSIRHASTPSPDLF
ncbi:winged helix-turn-helix domain-containing protein [Microbacterium sp. MPKO10]|uniref:winged helix-turn-helix domain-containing protein n=1 Tax=Microbacterium sp. MPKO10 TaxID=2989818 RepID=UPI0022358D40|nr:winged helix-turn-helix domain-containing protein [Microbacterium sp. MPKO10]MCW4456755.1 winged helix-turn-helix domain-containing protein [Microbacterium sp. MPKO10]